MDEKKTYTCTDEYDAKSKRHLLVCSMKIGSQAGKHVAEPVKLILKGNYGKGRASMHKALDFLGIGFLTVLGAALLFLLIPRSTPDLVIVDASVAPKEVITGGSSTLAFRYENTSKEQIRNGRLTFTFPEHFALEDFESAAEQVGQQTFDIGTVNPSEYGYIHVRGTMFGDVGGDQVFTTSFSYAYGENETDTKTKEHVFSPTASTLALELNVPKHLFSYQEIDGVIRYKNTGDVDFPAMKITPSWPEGFTLLQSDPALRDGAFYVSSIESGDEGWIAFTGRLADESGYSFTFTPSFEFQGASYTQEILNANVDILPSPIELSHTIEEEFLSPGEVATVTAQFENVSSYPLQNVHLVLETDPLVFGTDTDGDMEYVDGVFVQKGGIASIAPGERGSITLSLPVRSDLAGIPLSDLTEITVTTSIGAELEITIDEFPVTMKTLNDSQETRLSSPSVFQAVGRYWASTGDQLGRGPVPPLALETTKYWIFWSVSGTTNTLSDLELQAELGDNVQLTGRQSVSTGSAILEEDGSVVWRISEGAPTLPSGSRAIGAAFEVAITPGTSDIGTIPTLLGTSLFTARDTFTGAFISESSPAITTEIPTDQTASTYGGIVLE